MQSELSTWGRIGQHTLSARLTSARYKNFPNLRRHQLGPVKAADLTKADERGQMQAWPRPVEADVLG